MRDLHQALVGTWRLTAASAISDDGAIDESPFGTGPVGLLVYSADATVTALTSHGGRSRLSADPIASPTDERAQAFATFFAYAGRYSIAGDKISHHVEVASFQNWVGTDLVRTFVLDGDQLKLRTPPMMVGGKSCITELLWERAADEPGRSRCEPPTSA
jgi:hypothetical protein